MAQYERWTEREKLVQTGYCTINFINNNIRSKHNYRLIKSLNCCRFPVKFETKAAFSLIVY